MHILTSCPDKISRLKRERFFFKNENTAPRVAKGFKKERNTLRNGYFTKKESDGVSHQMIWPPQSPDLNPIEMVWDELDHGVKEKQHMWELRLLEKHFR